MSSAKQAWKSNYSVNVISGKKEDRHIYAEEKLVEPKANKWKTTEIEFTVIEGKEKVTIQLYRWAKDVTMNVDDFKLIKK